MRRPLGAREWPSAIFTSVRSVRATIGRMPTRAASSISALTGKQKRNSVPSVFKMLATAAAAFMATFYCIESKPSEHSPASFRCEILVEYFDLRGLVGNFAPDHQAARRARFDDAPLLANSHRATRQILFAL